MRIRRTASAALVLALAAALTSCGDDDKGTKATAPLTLEQITSALLQVEDVGEDFRVKDEDDEDDDTDLGCLNSLDSIDEGFPGAKDHIDVSIESVPDPNVPEVGNQISAFADEAAATQALEDFANSLADCEEVDETADGVSFALDVDTDDSKITDDVDAQFNLQMEGTITGEDLQLPIAQHASFMRIGNVITATYFSSFETSIRSEANDLAELVVAKILPVIDGGEVGKPDSLDLEPYTG